MFHEVWKKPLLYSICIPICLSICLCAAINVSVSLYLKWGQSLKQVQLRVLSLEETFEREGGKEIVLFLLSTSQRCDLYLSMCEKTNNINLTNSSPASAGLTPSWGVILLTQGKVTEEHTVPARAYSNWYYFVCVKSCVNHIVGHNKSVHSVSFVDSPSIWGIKIGSYKEGGNCDESYTFKT